MLKFLNERRLKMSTNKAYFDLIIGAIGFFILMALYFLPTILANKRKHRQHDPISIINLFLGWTVIGWVICLAWASSDNREK